MQVSVALLNSKTEKTDCPNGQRWKVPLVTYSAFYLEHNPARVSADGSVEEVPCEVNAVQDDLAFVSTGCPFLTACQASCWSLVWLPCRQKGACCSLWRWHRRTRALINVHDENASGQNGKA
ncbi:hypothetical protein NA57DRAFT_61874 [Rhizodiscina lignyota]|uniref:Uncharacterized protein n=1 Tax=Rhizodiscina lignyota TaxID=1504668 RepID=A0A9P4I6M2_9PEZI|nr:hypothetical protein NA57DRAFT_61874 [Rhizodiscina lignyota]